MRALKKSFTIFAVVGTIAMSGLAFGQQVEKVTDLVGRQLDYSMTTTAGKLMTDETNRGKVVLIDFWATWCGPCKAASPFMQELHKKYQRQGLVVVGANTWEQGVDSKTAATKYAKDHKYEYTMTTNNDKYAEQWGITGIPTFILVDENGVVKNVFVGFAESSKSKMETAVRGLLNATK